MTKPAGWKLRAAIAFATVYIVWGSTYLAIRVGVQRLPPALFAGVRFLAAGALLALYATATGQRWPRSWREWKIITIVGVLLLIGGNGLVVWGSQWIASNQAALIVASVALWIAGLGTLGRNGQPLSRQALIGLVIGLAGVGLLMHPAAEFAPHALLGQIAILGAAFLWASGTTYARHMQPSTPPFMSAALQSLVAGALLCVIGLATGEANTWHWSWTGSVALLYLIVFGAFAFAAYVWLMHEVAPAALGTYAYVNPAIAVVLGWWLLDEELKTPQLLGMTTILLGVILVSTAQTPAAARKS
ncbi:MAG: EamA family transporter [Sulfurifustis sp.]